MTWPQSVTRGMCHSVAELNVAAKGGQRGQSPCTALGSIWSQRERGKVKSSKIESKDFATIVKMKGLSFWGEDKTQVSSFRSVTETIEGKQPCRARTPSALRLLV